MKLTIDINDNEYLSIKNYPDAVTSYPITIHLYDAVRNGIPHETVTEFADRCRECGREKVLNKIRVEIDEIPLSEPIMSIDGLSCYGAKSINIGTFREKVLAIIDRHIGEGSE